MSTEDSHGYAVGETRRREAGVWMQQTAAFTRRYLRELFRTKVVLFWTVAFPAGFYLLAIVLFVPDSSEIASEGVVRAGTAVGYGMFGALIGALTSFGSQLGMDIENDRYVQFRSLSIAPSADLAGRMIAGTGLVVVAFLTVLVVSIPTGAQYSLQSPLSPLVAMVALATFAVFWMTVAVAISLAVSDSRYTSMVTTSLAIVAYMLSGNNGVTPDMFHGPDVLLNLMPHTLSTRLLVDHLVGTGGGITPPALPATGPGLGLMTIIAVVSLGTCLVLTRAYLYKREVVA